VISAILITLLAIAGGINLWRMSPQRREDDWRPQARPPSAFLVCFHPNNLTAETAEIAKNCQHSSRHNKCRIEMLGVASPSIPEPTL